MSPSPASLAELVHSSALDPASKYYWDYQFRLGQEVLVPTLQRYGAFRPGMSVAEIGCAEAGVLMAFLLAGAGRALGTDIAQNRLQTASWIAHQAGLELQLQLHDILHDPIPEDWRGSYELVLLRDVLEHLDDPIHALRQIGLLLRPGGTVWISFPPYPSPYGGHQHLLKNFWGTLPYIQLLPEPLFERLIASGREPDRTEVRRLRSIRLSLPQMPRIASAAGYRIAAEEHYLLRPVFRFRFRLPVPAFRITALCRRFPRVAQYICMEAGYLLQWKGAES
jgi:SAM-dependent methyltransferase